MRKTKGFTLIELLVVIAVISLLMAILTPALRRARELGQRAVCSSHLKTLMTATFAYATTYDGAYVPVIYTGIKSDGSTDQIQWLANPAFRSYLSLSSYEKGDEKIRPFDVPDEFLCPTDKISKNKKNRIYGVLCSYGYNITEFLEQYKWADEEGGLLKDPAGHRTHNIRQAAEKLAFVDGIDWWVEWTAADYRKGWDKLGQASIDDYRHKIDPQVYGPTIYRHNEGADVAFYDGHVKYLKKEDIFVIEDYEANLKKPGMWVVNLAFYREHHN